MLDRSIPFYNIIMRSEEYKFGEIVLPQGFYFKHFQKGDEKAWATLEYKIGDFNSAEEAEQYFLNTYCQNIKIIEQRGVFVVNEQNKIVGSCIAWKDKKGEALVASLHWLVIDPDYQGLKLGKALCQKTLEYFQQNGEFPVYIHTQPWSYKAINLYIQQGFQVMIKDTFADYENQYVQAIDTLKKFLSDSLYNQIISNSVQ